MSENVKIDTVVLGAGIVGACCTLSLLDSGHFPMLIDRKDPGECASFGNAGVISPWSCVPQCLPGVWKNIPKWLMTIDGPVTFQWRQALTMLPWMLRFFANGKELRVSEISDAMKQLMANNIEHYRYHLKGTGKEYLLKDSWYVNVFRGKLRPDLNDLAWKLRIDRGAPVRVIGRSELHELEPALSPNCHSAVIIEDQARAVHPGELTKALAEKAVKSGGVFLKAEIRELVPKSDGGFRLIAQGKEIHCNKLVLAAGIWSVEFLKPLGFRFPLVAERGYHAEFANPGVSLNHSVMDVDGKFVMSSMTGGLRVAGTTEFAAHDAPANHARSSILEKQAREILPDLAAQNAQYWMGIRSSFPDNLPAIGALPGFPGLYIAFGHSHYGMGMAPATGQIIANLLKNDQSEDKTSDFRVSRFV